MKIRDDLVRLETASGEFVHESTMPPFVEPPMVIQWGTRVFARHQAALNDAVYRECFYYFLPDDESVRTLTEG